MAPAKAQVVNVNSTRASRWSIEIPPRSSSLARISSRFIDDEGRKSRMSFHESPSLIDRLGAWESPTQRSKTSAQRTFSFPPIPPLPIDPATNSPPDSPQEYTTKGLIPDTPPRTSQIQRNIEFPDSPPRSVTPSDLLDDIISALKESTSGFPSTMLLPDTPCIAAIRSVLQQAYCLKPSSMNFPSPPSACGTSMSWHSDEVDSVCQQNSAATSLPPRSSDAISDANNTSFLDFQLDSPPAEEDEPCWEFPFPSTKLDLGPFRNIFPHTSDFMRSALYAHVLAYHFITTHDTSQSSHSSFDVPFYTTNSQGPPSKAASTLGLASSAKLARIINMDSSGLMIRPMDLEGSLLSCISQLMGGMEGRVSKHNKEATAVDRAFVRALVEVVKGCEERSWLTR